MRDRMEWKELWQTKSTYSDMCSADDANVEVDMNRKNQSTLSTGKFNFLLRLWHASWIPYKDKKLIEDFSDFSTKLVNSTHVENNFTHCEFHNPLKFEYIIKIFNEKRTQQKKEEPPKWRWWWAREREMNHKKCQHTKKCLCWRARSWERTKTEW